MKKDYQKKSTRAGMGRAAPKKDRLVAPSTPDEQEHTETELVLPASVTLAMADLAETATESLLALAVGTVAANPWCKSVTNTSEPSPPSTSPAPHTVGSRRRRSADAYGRPAVHDAGDTLLTLAAFTKISATRHRTPQEPDLQVTWLTCLAS